MKAVTAKHTAKAKHTPGPWRSGRADMATLVDGYPSKWIYSGDVKSIESGKSYYVAAASGMDIENWDEVMANAALIAAAPELLTALKLCVRLLGRFPSHDPNGEVRGDMVPDEAKAAITKAEGAQ